MRGLLIVLCSLVTTAAILAGGCAFLVSGLEFGIAAQGGDLMGLLFISLPVLLVAMAVIGINAALVAAVRKGRAPRRTGWFVMLAVVDLLAACCMFAAAVAQGVPGFNALLLPAALAAKGILTLRLPAEPTGPAKGGPLPPAS